MPSAAAANALHRPSGGQPPLPAELHEHRRGGHHRHPTGQRQIEHSPDRNACTARCNATNDDEHAVSTVTAGPSNPNVYATRPDATLPVVPVSPYPSSSAGQPPSRIA